MSGQAGIPPSCPNCGHRLAEPALPYCPACGQETRVQAPSLREFAQQFGGAYLSTEGALWRSLWLLLRRPGELTRQYLAGRRRHYVLPLRLYLTISVLTLLLLRTVDSTVSLDFDAAHPPPELRNGKINLVILGNAGLKNGVFYCHDMPHWMCARLQRRLDLEPKALGQQLGAFKDRFVNNLGSGMFLLLPGFALWLKLVYFNRRLRYTEHLVFALHVHAFWFLALALSLPVSDIPWLSVPLFLSVPWYTLAAMRRVYGGRRWPRLMRAALISALYGFSLVLVLAAIALWSLLV
jgi:hypothetical protein